MPLFIVRNNIVHMDTDAIVNTANHRPLVGSGLDKAVYDAAGLADLLAWRKTVGVIEVGNAVASPAFRLSAKCIIHTVGPLWCGGMSGEADALAKCYRSVLMTAVKNECQSVAVPLISTGNFRFPKELALNIARDVITDYLAKHDLTVYLVVFDNESYGISRDLFDHVSSYIDAHYVRRTVRQEYEGISCMRNCDADRRYNAIPQGASASMMRYTETNASAKTAASPLKYSLPDIMNDLEDSFAEALFRYIDARGMTDPEVYKRANLDRKLFSKIRKNKAYQPSKNTAIALAIALKLNLEETKEFIAKAGYALTHTSRADIIVEYFITRKEYDIFKLNEVLFEFDQPLLGSKVA
ncbi:MAG: macro domain-containing protein [Selenomonadales bacterium]|nr:macro domain-containing protein [Selenomonadales bacterium]